MDSTISFSQYIIKDETINKLKKQRNILKEEIQKFDRDYELYSFAEKEKAFVLLDNYLKIEQVDCKEELKKKIETIKKYKAKLKELQNEDDKSKIQHLSKYITKLYYEAKETSSFIKEDTSKDGFKIQYIKRGNILQPIINSKNNENVIIAKNYNIGSKARMTLIQLCGYLGFLKLLIEDNKYPLIPVFICDHLSQAFDKENVNAIGAIINKALTDIGIGNIQIFLFDDKTNSEMNINANNVENLCKIDEDGNLIQTGFIPFYRPAKKNTEQK